MHGCTLDRIHLTELNMMIIMVGESQIFPTSMSDLGILNCLLVMGYPQSLGSTITNL